MMPIRLRTRIWPLAALATALAFASVAVSDGLAGDQPAASRSGPSSTTDTPGARPAPGLHPASPDRLISYEVRFIELSAGPWRDHMKGRITPLGPDAGARGWLVDEDALISLLRHLMKSTAANLVQAPKVTAFEGARATIFNGPDRMSGSTHVEGQEEVARTAAGGRDERIRIDLGGTLSPRGTRLSVDLRDPTHPAGRDARDARYEGSCDVPEGSSLLVSLGHHEGLDGRRPVKLERLAVITPRRVVLEPEPRTAAEAADKAVSGTVAR